MKSLAAFPPAGRAAARLASLALVLVGVAVLPGRAARASEPSTGPAGGPVQRTFEFTYSVSLQDLPADAQSIGIWVPVPTSGPDQIVRDLRVVSPLGHSLLPEDQYGNSLVQVTAHAPFPPDLSLRVQAIVERHAVNVFAPGQEDARVESASHQKPMKEDLEANALVPIDGQVAEIAQKVTADAKTDLEKARAIYDYVTSTMTYDKSGDGWGRGDAIYACNAKAGNCTDFHSLIMGMARASHIPARFVMGFPLPEKETSGEIGGYHCWAQLYVDGVGWLPVDSSEASKHPEKKNAFFGGLDANRVRFSMGRDLKIRPDDTKRLNYLIYPYVEVDGVEVDAASTTKVQRTFSFREVESQSKESK